MMVVVFVLCRHRYIVPDGGNEMILVASHPIHRASAFHEMLEPLVGLVVPKLFLVIRTMAFEVVKGE